MGQVLVSELEYTDSSEQGTGMAYGHKRMGRIGRFFLDPLTCALATVPHVVLQ